MVSLDVGCGFNKVSPYFIGVDKQKTPVTDYVLDAENLSAFRDGSIHAIYTERALQHVNDDVKAIREMYRCLSNDGVLIIEVSRRFNSYVCILFCRLGVTRQGKYEVFHVYSKRDLVAKVERVGFKVASYGLVPTRFVFKNHLLVLVKTPSNSQDKSSEEKYP